MDLPTGRSATTLDHARSSSSARTLGLDIVAEGVETEEQRDALTELDCGSAQGYLFARPEPADEAGARSSGAPSASRRRRAPPRSSSSASPPAQRSTFSFSPPSIRSPVTFAFTKLNAVARRPPGRPSTPPSRRRP